MSFLTEKFCHIRPYAYHLTARANLPRIRRSRSLESASELMAAAGDLSDLRNKRHQHLPIRVMGDVVLLRDQAPLHQSNVELLDGWQFEDLIEALNSRVFFWPGTETGANKYGENHLNRYRHENPAMIRVNTASLLEANHDQAPEFCKYNSGAPRYSGGRRSPRGPNTFTPCDEANFTASQVVEFVLPSIARLPDDGVEVLIVDRTGWEAL